jgi:hypothetical protein
LFTPSPWFPLLPSLLITSVIKSFLKRAQFNPEDGGSYYYEILSSAHKITRCHNPEDHNINNHSCEEELT